MQYSNVNVEILKMFYSLGKLSGGALTRTNVIQTCNGTNFKSDYHC